MSKSELLEEIERLRLKLYRMYESGVGYQETLKISQELDVLIIKYHRTAL